MLVVFIQTKKDPGTFITSAMELLACAVLYLYPKFTSDVRNIFSHIFMTSFDNSY